MNHALAPRLIASGPVGYSTTTGNATATTGTSNRRTDTTIGAAVLASRSVAIFVAVGHPVSDVPWADGGPWIAGGLSFHLMHR